MPTPPIDSVRLLMDGQWNHLQPTIERLLKAKLDEGSVAAFLDEWSTLAEIQGEAYSRLFVATTINTADQDAQDRYSHFRSTVHPKLEHLDQELTRKLLDSNLAPAGMALPIRRLRSDAEQFRPENQPLQNALVQLGVRYNGVTGARTVEWDGQETTTTQLRPIFQGQDRAQREQAWRLQHVRQHQDRDTISEIWGESLVLKQQIATNAGFKDYRSFRWEELHRYDYEPTQSIQFHKAIAEVVVPAASRIYAWRRNELGLSSLRPWDLDVDPLGAAPLRPFNEVEELIGQLKKLFNHLDPTLGSYFDTLSKSGLLDLDNRKNKAPVGYCIRFPVVGLPFIFTNAVGVQRDVQTLCHESGHAFHAFETKALPWLFQRSVGAEFSEVASMAMEFLIQDLLDHPEVGIYNPAEASQARLQYLENRLLLWPRVAAIDAFQHWAYSHPAEAAQPEMCNKTWRQVSQKFMPDVDWSGLEHYREIGWQSVTHIHNAPFYYVEYGLALLGAVQIWANSRRNRAEAVQQYRDALAMGSTASMPELYKTAGASFTFDAPALQDAVGLLMTEIESLWG